MKNIRTYVFAACWMSILCCASCGKRGEGNNGSESQTTANDSSGAESRKAMGVGEGNQDEKLGYPSNQSNLNNDSTSRQHDDDTLTKKPMKDKPNKHEE